MTEEQIGQKAKEYSLRVNGHYYPIIPEDFNKSIGEVTENAFVEGINFANKHWQEKTRWIPVTERLPEIRKEAYVVLVRSNNKDIETFNVSNKTDIEIIYDWCTHWKEII